jgi:hypothetical protein
MIDLTLPGVLEHARLMREVAPEVVDRLDLARALDVVEDGTYFGACSSGIDGLH